MPWFAIRIPVKASWVSRLEELSEQQEVWPWLLSTSLQGEPMGELSGFFPSREAALLARDQLFQILPSTEITPLPEKPEPVSEEEQDWESLYRAHFEPWSMGGIHWVPIWQRNDYHPPQGEKVIWLDPGMAFGTGNHETTRLCLAALAEWVQQKKDINAWSSEETLIDAGCGSGILAFSAAALGFHPVVGFDNDPLAVEIARKNTGLQETVCPSPEFRCGDLSTGWPSFRGQVVVANILAPVLVENRQALAKAVAPGGTLILSGILTSEAEDVADFFRPFFRHCSQKSMGEWSAIILDRPAR